MSDRTAGDEHMGMFVYCRSHVGPHSTGWCTVTAEDKIPLQAKTYAEAAAEVVAKDWKMYRGDHFSGTIDP